MSEAFRRLSLIEDLPPDTPPSDVLAVVRIRRERRRADIVDTALAIGRTVQICTWGGDLSTAFSHLLTDAERQAMEREREEKEQLAVQMAQVASLMQWGKKFDR